MYRRMMDEGMTLITPPPHVLVAINYISISEDYMTFCLVFEDPNPQ